jgi:carnitine 3-dehydrogenase
MSTIKTVGIAGAGVIGAGWAARAMWAGYDVVAYDPFDKSASAHARQDRTRLAVDDQAGR